MSLDVTKKRNLQAGESQSIFTVQLDTMNVREIPQPIEMHEDTRYRETKNP